MFSSKDPFNIFGVVVMVVGGGGVFYIFDVPSGEAFNDFRWNPTGEEGGGQENTILKGMSKMYGPNEIVTTDDRDPPWINIKIKSLVENKTGYFKIYSKPSNAASLRHFEQM